METNPAAVGHFERGLAELKRQRSELDRQIEVADTMIRQLRNGSKEPPDGPAGPAPESPTHIARPIRVIAAEMAERDEVITLVGVVRAAAAEGNPAQYASISSVLSSMQKEGLLERGPKRGSYRRVTGAAEPATTEAAEPTEHAGGLPPEEGGEATAQPPE